VLNAWIQVGLEATRSWLRHQPAEHDFGSFKAEGRTIFFKIDYFDKSLTHHSPDPSDPSVTERVITIMLADEY
jgi:Protein of unknown function (DUF3768)